jgi:hypothetical protein
MNSLVRRLALRATAKVALGMTVVGCTAHVTVEPVEGDDETPYPNIDAPEQSDDEEATNYPVYVPPVQGEELVCSAPPLGGVVDVDDVAQYECCVDAVEPVAPPNADWESWDATITEPGITACCGVMLAQGEVNPDIFAELDWATFNACCFATNSTSGACTPWGPPPPPAVFELPRLDLPDLGAVA